MTAPASKARIKQLLPLLAVDDIQQSISFYRDKLGFTLTAQADDEGSVFWCRMDLDGAALMLQQAEEDEDGPAAGRGRGVTFYFVCEDADRMFEELTARGLRLNPPSAAYYGMNQLFVPEPNGYALCFESAIQTETNRA